MAEITYLKWSIDINYDKSDHENWISVVDADNKPVSSGSGNTEVYIKVTDAECYDATDLHGSVVFNCSDCTGEQTTNVIPIVRCKPEDCGTPKTELEYDTVEIYGVGKCEESRDVEVPFTSTTSYYICGCPSASTTGITALTVNFGKNYDDYEKVHCFNIEREKTQCNNAIIRIHQEAGPCGKFVTLTLYNGEIIEIEGSGLLTDSMINQYMELAVKAEIGTLCTGIDYGAFNTFTAMTTCTISNTVTSIGNAAFQGCTSLTSIDIPNSVTSIGKRAFANCTNLTNVTLPNMITNIADAAFYSCTSLTSIDIPNSVTSIDSSAFYSCRCLTSCTIGSGVRSIGGVAFASCVSLTSITLPNSVTNIADAAFAGCSSFTSITFPSSVTNIGSSVLTACTSLERITVERIEPPIIESNTFVNTNECPIYVPCESVQTYKTSWSQYAYRITCDSVDCDAYEFNIDVNYFNYDETEGDIATTTSSMPQLTATVKSGFITNPITVRKDGDYYYYSATFSENTGSPFSRSAVIEFTDGKGCVFSEDVGQGGVGCEGYYGLKRETSEVSSDSGRYLIATSNASMAALTPTITEGSSFLTEVEVFQNLTKYEYYGHFNPNTSTSSRTAEIIYRSYQVDGCVFRQTVKQKGKEGGDETYTVYVTSEPDESSCARVLIADGGSIEFTLSIGVGGTTHTLKYLVNNRQEFGGNLESFGTINVPIGQISSFDFNYLSTDTGNILKANSSSNGNKLPELTTQWSTLSSNTELWEGGTIPNLCTGDENGNRFVVSWDINTTTKTIVIYYMYQDIN